MYYHNMISKLTNWCDFHSTSDLGGWQLPSRGLPARHSLQMSTKPVTTRATTATRAGCVQRGMCQTTPFSGRGSRNAAGNLTQKCCRTWPPAQYTPAEHRGAHCKQDLYDWAETKHLSMHVGLSHMSLSTKQVMCSELTMHSDLMMWPLQMNVVRLKIK